MKGVLKFLLLCLSLSQSVMANDNVKSGTLQAYWLPEWHGNINLPSLQLRFVADDKSSAHKIININRSDVSREFIARHFTQIPDGFFKYKEGHAEQYGMVKINNLTVTTECDDHVYQADLISFTAQPIKKAWAEQGCDSYPWLITLRLKQGIQESELLSRPEQGSQSVAKVSSQTSLIKIKSISQAWFYVATYDESQPGLTGPLSGYIPANRLEPVN